MASEDRDEQLRELGERDQSVVVEIYHFLRVRKKFWLAPIILALVLLGALFVVAMKYTAVSPFIYAL